MPQGLTCVWNWAHATNKMRPDTDVMTRVQRLCGLAGHAFLHRQEYVKG